jgi:hypothetical protein
MAEIKYGAFEGNPARFTDHEAWVYSHDNVWRETNPTEVRMHAALLSDQCATFAEDCFPIRRAIIAAAAVSPELEGCDLASDWNDHRVHWGRSLSEAASCA